MAGLTHPIKAPLAFDHDVNVVAMIVQRSVEKPFDLSELISCNQQAEQPGDLLLIDTQDV
jgi:hypothetical protein